MFVAPCSVDWSDIGSFDAYYEFCQKDNDGNVILGVGTIEAINCKSCFIYCDDKTLKISNQKDKIIVSSDGNVIILNRLQ